MKPMNIFRNAHGMNLIESKHTTNVMPPQRNPFLFSVSAILDMAITAQANISQPKIWFSLSSIKYPTFGTSRLRACPQVGLDPFVILFFHLAVCILWPRGETKSSLW